MAPFTTTRVTTATCVDLRELAVDDGAAGIAVDDGDDDGNGDDDDDDDDDDYDDGDSDDEDF